MTTNPIAGNQWFTQVSDTVVTPNSVNNALALAGQAPLKFVQGTVTPTAAGNYDLGQRLPVGALVTNVFLRGSSDLAGGTNAEVVLSPTVGGGAGVNLQAAVVVLADLLLGENPPLSAAVSTADNGTNPFLSLTTTGTFTAGTITATVFYFDTQIATF